MRMRILGVLFALAFVGPLPSHANPSIVVDASSGEVLQADEATRPWHPASTTKMMTAYLLLKAVREGRVSLETALVASKNAAGQRPSKAGIKAGQEITVDNALKIMMVKSANDLAVVIAENLSGSVPGFVAEMNAESRRLGMRETLWTNANGWHDARQRTSARDLAILARALWYEFPEFRGYWGIGAVQLGNKVLKNTNGLVGRYPGIVGMKTGYVCASGFNLVSMAERNGRLLISVVLGASSGPERVVASARLLDEAFDSGGLFSSRSTGYSLATLPASSYSGPTNVREQVCGKGRKAFLLSEEESDAPVVFAPSSDGEADSTLALLMRQAQQPATRRTVQSSNGRLTLGERVLGAPVPVFFGRSRGTEGAPALIASRKAAPEAETVLEPAPGALVAARPPTLAEEPQLDVPLQAGIGEPIMLPGVEAVETPAAAASLAPKSKARSPSKAKPGAIMANVDSGKTPKRATPKTKTKPNVKASSARKATASPKRAAKPKAGQKAASSTQ